MRFARFRDSDYLEHIARRIVRIEVATSGVDLADFLGDEDLRAATERYIEIIGEAAGKLSQHTRDLAPNIPWSQIIGARNVITHGYAEIEPGRIGDIVKVHIPALRAAIDQLRHLVDDLERADPPRHDQPGELSNRSRKPDP